VRREAALLFLQRREEGIGGTGKRPVGAERKINRASLTRARQSDGAAARCICAIAGLTRKREGGVSAGFEHERYCASRVSVRPLHSAASNRAGNGDQSRRCEHRVQKLRAHCFVRYCRLHGLHFGSLCRGGVFQRKSILRGAFSRQHETGKNRVRERAISAESEMRSSEDQCRTWLLGSRG